MLFRHNEDFFEDLFIFFKNQLKINTIANFGELKVINKDTSKPLSKVYIKVFSMSKSTRKPKFFRDGYTDIRGKFEYAQNTGDKLKDVDDFAILISSDVRPLYCLPMYSVSCLYASYQN